MSDLPHPDFRRLGPPPGSHMVVAGGCGGDAHMAQRIHHLRGSLIVVTAVAELPFATHTKGVQRAFLGC